MCDRGSFGRGEVSCLCQCLSHLGSCVMGDGEVLDVGRCHVCVSVCPT